MEDVSEDYCRAQDNIIGRLELGINNAIEMKKSKKVITSLEEIVWTIENTVYGPFARFPNRPQPRLMEVSTETEDVVTWTLESTRDFPAGFVHSITYPKDRELYHLTTIRHLTSWYTSEGVLLGSSKGETG
jgi:hypothetical protein